MKEGKQNKDDKYLKIEVEMTAKQVWVLRFKNMAVDTTFSEDDRERANFYADWISKTFDDFDIKPSKTKGVTFQTRPKAKYRSSKSVHAQFIALTKWFAKIDKSEQEPDSLRMGMHFIGQQFREGSMIDPQEEADYLAKRQGLDEVKINRTGISLSLYEQKIIEGITLINKDTGYKGHSQKEIERRKYADITFPSIPHIPVIITGQNELLRASGIDPNNRSQKQQALEALKQLAEEQNLFIYKRLARDKNGKPKTDRRTQKYIMEDVQFIDTLLKVKTITEENTGRLVSYEIMPSPLLLDDYATYYITLPKSWRDEIDKAAGKRASPYTYAVCIYLRMAYKELSQRKSENYEIAIPWTVMAEKVSMPESLRTRNRSRAKKIIDEAYDIAVKAGYLEKVVSRGQADTLHLNTSKYRRSLQNQ